MNAEASSRMHVHTHTYVCYIKWHHTLGQQELSERWLCCLVQPQCWLLLAHLGSFSSVFALARLSIKGLEKWESWLVLHCYLA